MSNNSYSPPSNNDRHDVIDLVSSPSSLQVAQAHLPSPARLPARASAHSAARSQARRLPYNSVPVAFIQMHDDDDSSLATIPIHSRAQEVRLSRTSRKRRFKADPNELLEGETNKGRHRTSQDVVNLKSSDGDDSIEVIESLTVVVPPKPELQVLDVFPDADLPAVLTLLAQYDNHVATVVQHMAERSYPKSETKRAVVSTGLVRMQQNGTAWMHDYTSTESFVPSATYIYQAKEQLLSDFPFLSTSGAATCLKKFQNHYAVCHDKLLSAIKGTGDDDAQYDRVLAAFQGKPLQADQTIRIRDLLANSSTPTRKQHRKRKSKPLISDAVLQDELKYVGAKVREWMQVQQARRDRERNKIVSQRDGTAVECSCCFDAYPMDDMVSCQEEGHLFCVGCLKSFTENLIFGNGNLGIDKKTKKPALELKCFHGDGCSSGFSRAHLEKALPRKSLQKYDEVQFQVSIERAGLSASVCSCPKCGFQADVPDQQKIFECPVAECGYASCRECGEAAHIPLRCIEVEKEKVTKGRLVVEEAISAAMIRKCPVCNKGFIKSDGCNKITCGCGAHICYLCRKQIKDYTHFCQVPHCDHKENCKKCPVHSTNADDDARAMREAGYAAAEQVAKANGDTGLQIDVDSILTKM